MKKNLIIMANDSSSWIGGLYYKCNVLFSLINNKWIINNYNIIVKCNQYSKEYMKNMFDDESHNTITFVNDTDNIESRSGLSVVFPTTKICDFNKGISWIPDFQHRYFKKYFPIHIRFYRNIKFYILYLFKFPVVLSSNQSLNDFRKFYGSQNDKICIFHFVSYIEPIIKSIDKDYIIDIRKKHGLVGKKIVCIMNQFWQHKNHEIVFKAIAYLKHHSTDSLYNTKFVFTGKMEDYRNPGYIDKLTSIINKNDIAEQLSVLGFIERKEQLALMMDSEFVIQPSLFEGWGTVLEDAKVLDKTILLSDIPVHREQKSLKSKLFDPFDCIALGNLIEKELASKHEDNIVNGINDMKIRATEYSKSFEEFLKKYF